MFLYLMSLDDDTLSEILIRSIGIIEQKRTSKKFDNICPCFPICIR